MSNRADSSYTKMTFWMGQDTSQRIISRVYWEHMADDIRQFIKNCETCQRVNDAKFIMVDAALHPIPVKSQVWNQVHCICTCPHVCLTFFFVL